MFGKLVLTNSRHFFCKKTFVLIFPQTGSFIRVRQILEASQEKRKEAIYDVLLLSNFKLGDC